MNSLIQETFRAYTKMLKEQKKNRFKISAAENIIRGLDSYSSPIKTTEDIQKFMKFLGKKNAKKSVARIQTILDSRELPEVTEYYAGRDNKTFEAIDELTTVYGIGPAKAQYLVKECNVKSLQDLLKKIDDVSLTAAQQLGVRYYSDLKKRIRRAEISTYETLLQKNFQKLDPAIRMCITGSYRRGNKTSGDIDVLLTSSSPLRMEDILQSISLISTFEIAGILAKGKKKSMLLTRINKKAVRHMDIIITTPEQFPFAQLYFTGSKIFNIKMRQHALKKGYHLNEYNLTPVESAESEDTQPIMVFETEKDIFDFLEYPYVLPVER